MQSWRRELRGVKFVSLTIPETWPVEKTSNSVIVIGAGVAGLAAARELRRAGVPAIVFEARDRIGGRLLTLRDSETAIPIELGAEFVHGVHPDLWSLVSDMRVPVVELAGEHWTRDAAGFHKANSGWEQMGRIFHEMSRAPEQSFADFINNVRAPEEAKRAATGFVEGFNAANKDLVSVKWLNAEDAASDEIDGDRAFRVLAGYDRVAAYLARDLDIRLSTEVMQIRWRRGEAEIFTPSGEFRCAKVVIAVPFAILNRQRLQIDPDPPALGAARAAIVTGNAIRITFRFPRAIWANIAPDISFIHGGADFPVWWTAYPVQTPVITGWAAGLGADALAGRSEADLKRIALRSLRGLLGEDPGEPEGAWMHDWRNDPFSLGAYSYVRVNGMAAHAQLRGPVESTLWFAGEALATGHMGTVHGAISSGIAAAQSILRDLP